MQSCITQHTHCDLLNLKTVATVEIMRNLTEFRIWIDKDEGRPVGQWEMTFCPITKQNFRFSWMEHVGCNRVKRISVDFHFMYFAWLCIIIINFTVKPSIQNIPVTTYRSWSVFTSLLNFNHMKFTIFNIPSTFGWEYTWKFFFSLFKMATRWRELKCYKLVITRKLYS